MSTYEEGEHNFKCVTLMHTLMPTALLRTPIKTAGVASHWASTAKVYQHSSIVHQLHMCFPVGEVYIAGARMGWNVDTNECPGTVIFTCGYKSQGVGFSRSEVHDDSSLSNCACKTKQ